MDGSPLTKRKIIQLIKNHDSSVTFVKPKTKSSTSEVWSTFSYICVGDRQYDFVSCDKCKDVLHHKSIDGTSSMIKHMKLCLSTKKNVPDTGLSIKEYLRPTTSQYVPKNLKEKVTNSTVEFVALDNRAFELISGEGFLNLAQTIFAVGQSLCKTPNVNVYDLLPCSSTVSRNVDKLYNLKKHQLTNICQKLKSFTVVVDFWTDLHTGISFCGIALSYLNDKLQLHVFILGCFPYDRDNQTSNQIRQFVDSKLMEFSLSLDDNKFVVCDNENKMKSSFKDGCIRIGCSIHYLNKQLEHCFTTNVIDKVPVKCELVQELFTHVRKIVSHTRRAHKQTKLSRKLQSYSNTRFNGAFLTMNVFLLVFEELSGILDRAYMDDYELIDKDLLSYICSFLVPFEEALDQFSSDTKPTIYQVLPLRQCLLSHCKVNADDHDGIEQVKIFLEKRIREVWILHDVHYISTLLHPRLKNFDKFPDLHATAIDLTKAVLLKRQPPVSSIICATGMNSAACTAELGDQPSTSKSLLQQCFDSPKSNLKSSTTPYEELEKYMAMDTSLDEMDVLSFWLAYKHEFPTLFSIVQDYYAIPASNTTIERLFSASKNTITDKRTSLAAERVNKLLFLQKNLRLLKEIAEQSGNELSETQTKRKQTTPAPSSSHDNHNQFTTTTIAKKFKLNEENDGFFSNSDSEHDDIFFVNIKKLMA